MFLNQSTLLPILTLLFNIYVILVKLPNPLKPQLLPKEIDLMISIYITED